MSRRQDLSERATMAVTAAECDAPAEAAGREECTSAVQTRTLPSDDVEKHSRAPRCVAREATASTGSACPQKTASSRDCANNSTVQFFVITLCEYCTTAIIK